MTATPPLPPHSARPRVPLLLTVAAALGVLVVVFAGAIAGFFAIGGLRVDLRHITITQALIVQLFSEVPIVPYLLWVMVRVWKRTPDELGFRTPAWRDVGIAALGFLAMMIVVQGASAVIQSALHVQHQQAPVQLLHAIRSPGTLAFFAIFAALIAPPIEELTFRVFLFNAAHSYWRFWPAALFSGVFFAFAHADKYAFVPLIFGGVILCKVYDYTRNAWTSMITHGLFNGTTIIALVAAQKAGLH